MNKMRIIGIPRQFVKRALICCMLPVFASVSSVTMAQNFTGWYKRPAPPPPPKWSLELKTGDFRPDTQEFRDFFDIEEKHSALALGYKIIRTVEIGFEIAGDINKTVDGVLSLNNTGINTGVTYSLQPSHLYVLLRGIWGEDQIGVPYIGAGVTRADYKISVPGQESISGTAEGSYQRYGLQILIDQADPSAASELSRDTGINNVYLFVEKHAFEADKDGIEFGGETTMVGLLFEF